MTTTERTVDEQTQTDDQRYEIELLDSVEDVSERQWNSVVEQATLGSVFHRHGWLRAIERGLYRKPAHLAAYKDGNLFGVFPNFVVDIDGVPARRLESVAPGYCGPVVTTDERELLERFTEAVQSVGPNDVLSHVIRTDDSGYIRYHRFLTERGYQPTLEACRIVVDLRCGWDGVLARMKKDRRRKIRQGQQRTIEIRDEPVSDRTMARFYRGYRAVIDRVGGEALPQSFLRNLTEMDDRVMVLSLTVDGEDAGEALYLLDDERSSVHCFLSAVQSEHFQYNASELLDAHAMQWAIENDYDTYDLGLTTADFEDGLFQFKMSLGGRPVPTIDWERGVSSGWELFALIRAAYQRSDRLQGML